MELRGLVYPTPERPLVIIMLRRESFRNELAGWLREVIFKCKEHNLPHHQPKGMLVEGNANTIASSLHNSWQFLASLAAKVGPVCACHKLKPLGGIHAITADGHVCLNFTSLSESQQFFIRSELDMLTANAKEAVYPTREDYYKILARSVTAYCAGNYVAIGTLGSSKAFHKLVYAMFKEQWELHEQALKSMPAHTAETLASVANKLDGCVIHCEDHAYTKTLAFCPIQYQTVVLNTFVRDESVFSRVASSVETAHRIVKESLPEKLAKGCKWAFRGQDPQNVTTSRQHT